MLERTISEENIKTFKILPKEQLLEEIYHSTKEFLVNKLFHIETIFFKVKLLPNVPYLVLILLPSLPFFEKILTNLFTV